MLGSTNKDEDKKLAKKKVIQALQSNEPVRIAGYETQFSPDTTKKERAAFATRPTRPGTRMRSNVSSNKRGYYGPDKLKEEGIKAPQSIGDVFRYNREVKAKNTADNLANEQAKTGISAFSAEQQAEHLTRSDDTANRRVDVTSKYYDQSNALGNRRADITEENYANTNALGNRQADITEEHYANTDANAATRTASDVEIAKKQLELDRLATESQNALRAAETDRTRTQALKDDIGVEAHRAKSNVETNIAQEKQALADNPNRSPARLQALMGDTRKPLTAEEAAKLKNEDLELFIKYRGTLRPGIETDDAIEQFKAVKAANDRAALRVAPNVAPEEIQREDETEEEYINRLLQG